MSKSLKQKLVAYGLVLPAFLVVMLTVAYPIISAVIPVPGRWITTSISLQTLRR